MVERKKMAAYLVVCAALVVFRSRLAKNELTLALRTACGTGGTVPVPLSHADRGEPEALSATEIGAAKAACRERR